MHIAVKNSCAETSDLDSWDWIDLTCSDLTMSCIFWHFLDSRDFQVKNRVSLWFWTGESHGLLLIHKKTKKTMQLQFSHFTQLRNSQDLRMIRRHSSFSKATPYCQGERIMGYGLLCLDKHYYVWTSIIMSLDMHYYEFGHALLWVKKLIPGERGGGEKVDRLLGKT